MPLGHCDMRTLSDVLPQAPILCSECDDSCQQIIRFLSCKGAHVLSGQAATRRAIIETTAVAERSAVEGPGVRLVECPG